MATTIYDTERAEAFAGRMLDALNQAALVLMTSIGHRTGLFDVLAEAGEVTSAELAEEAGLQERYVREWLAAMTTAGVVEHDPEEGWFRLPAEHAAWLTRSAAPDNLAVTAQWIPVLATVEDDVVRSFEQGGGVPYERYERFHEVMAEESSQTVLATLFSHILPLAPGAIERLEAGACVADLGCGRGRAVIAMAERFPNSHFVGYDLSAAAIAEARAAARHLDNVEFRIRDLSTFDSEAPARAYDLVTTFDAVHDQARPLAMLRGIKRALKADGIYLMQDIKGSSHVHENLDHPTGTFMYTISCLHCMTVSLAQGGDGLGAMWGEQQARALLAEAGFGSVDLHTLDHDPFNAYYVVR
jgi:2-polyprenyl-3-methyl-5-hydroxy-6-metoxy-1,4-benzoquinol methylase